MSSSISSSDAANASGWGRCLKACLGVLGITAALFLALMVLVDPYDSGRFGLLGIAGVDDKLPYTANASRARDPQFDAAIIGNSTGQLLKPAELSQSTAAHFVQLVAPGADPRGQLAILDFFIRHHHRVGALVVVIDDLWCVPGITLPAQETFPFWLYGDSTLAYAGHLFSWRSLDRAVQRITIGLGSRQRMEPDGFWSYEEVWPPGEKRPPLGPQPSSPPFNGTASDTFPYRDMLDRAVRKLPPDVPVVLLVPPTFYTIIPQPGSQAAAERTACNAAFRSIVAGRPHSNLLDYRIDNALTRDPQNFADLIHYREKIARKLDRGIAESMRLGDAARIDF
jgi:hypothetical protein